MVNLEFKKISYSVFLQINATYDLSPEVSIYYSVNENYYITSKWHCSTERRLNGHEQMKGKL